MVSFWGSGFGRALILSLFGIVAIFIAPRAACAADNDWLTGHWEGHDTGNPNDKKDFAMDVSPVNPDGTFTAAWNATGRPTGRATGKIEQNVVKLFFAASDNSVSLTRSSNGGLAGGVSDKDGHQTAALAFQRVGPSAAGALPAGRSCTYRAPSSAAKGKGTLLHAQDGEEVIAVELGKAVCRNGQLVRTP